MKRQPEFTEEEMVLLLRCYLQYREEGFSAIAPHVVELSKLLRSLPIHPQWVRENETFRNCAGIDAQLRTIAVCDPQWGKRRWKKPSRLMKYYWDIYVHRHDLLHRDAQAIIDKYAL